MNVGDTFSGMLIMLPVLFVMTPYNRDCPSGAFLLPNVGR